MNSIIRLNRSMSYAYCVCTTKFSRAHIYRTTNVNKRNEKMLCILKYDFPDKIKILRFDLNVFVHCVCAYHVYVHSNENFYLSFTIIVLFFCGCVPLF